MTPRLKTGPSALAACALGALLAAGSAQAANFTLTMSAPATATAGQPSVIQVSGNNPPDQGVLYLDIDEIPSSLAASCPGDVESARQLATSGGGQYVAFVQRENEDANGNFSAPVAYTPKSVGQKLLCGYTHDYTDATLATSSASVDVTAGGGNVGAQAPAKPANVKRPRVTRSGGKLACSTGSWSNGPTGYSYGWLVNGKAKPGAHGRRLAISRKLRGHKVACSVTAANGAGSSTAVSAPFKVR
jgi:hypothetical protein